MSASGVPARWARASSRARSGSRRSLRVTTSSPWRTPSAASASTCSADWGIQPSSAATTSSTAGTGPTPASIVVTNRSCPGTSTNATSAPEGSVVQANPRSIVMPRRRSSAHRSGSIPVSARTSVDLPWSTCPAVATTCMSSTAAASVSSASAGSARRSSRQRPRSRRPSTAGSPARSAAAKDSGSATAALGNATPGAPPPPTVASVSTASAGTPPRRRSSASRDARACSAAGATSRPCRTGVAGPRRVASIAARVSLSTRSARASGCRRRRPTSSAPSPGAPRSSPA